MSIIGSIWITKTIFIVKWCFMVDTFGHLLYVCVFKDLLKNHHFPLCPELSMLFIVNDGLSLYFDSHWPLGRYKSTTIRGSNSGKKSLVEMWNHRLVIFWFSTIRTTFDDNYLWEMKHSEVLWYAWTNIEIEIVWSKLKNMKKNIILAK